MTITLPAVESMSGDLKDLDFEISCAAKDCENAADWWNVCLACGAHTPICEAHRRQKVLSVEAASPLMVVVCPECLAAAPARAWRHLFSFVPIGRS